MPLKKHYPPNVQHVLTTKGMNEIDKASSVIIVIKYENTAQVRCHERAGCVCASDAEPLQKQAPKGTVS